MHMDDARRTRALMQVIDVLRHKGQGAAALGERVFEPRQREMRPVGLGVPEIAPTLIVEREQRFGIAGESLGSRELHRVELRPDSLALLSRNVPSPLSAETPAPVRTKMFLGMLVLPSPLQHQQGLYLSANFSKDPRLHNALARPPDERANRDF